MLYKVFINKAWFLWFAYWSWGCCTDLLGGDD